MIADAIPREKMPRAFAIQSAGVAGGGALSLLIGAALYGLLVKIPPTHVAGIGVIHNWQLVFMIVGFPGLLVAVKLLFGPLAVFLIWRAVAPYGKIYRRQIDGEG